MSRNHMCPLAYCFVLSNPWCPSSALCMAFEWSDEGIRMVFPVSVMLSDVASSLKVSLYGIRACWSYIVMYLFTMDCDNTYICWSLYITWCISLMVREVGRHVCIMVSWNFLSPVPRCLSLCPCSLCVWRGNMSNLLHLLVHIDECSCSHGFWACDSRYLVAVLFEM